MDTLDVKNIFSSQFLVMVQNRVTDPVEQWGPPPDGFVYYQDDQGDWLIEPDPDYVPPATLPTDTFQQISGYINDILAIDAEEARRAAEEARLAQEEALANFEYFLSNANLYQQTYFEADPDFIPPQSVIDSLWLNGYIILRDYRNEEVVHFYIIPRDMTPSAAGAA